MVSFTSSSWFIPICSSCLSLVFFIHLVSCRACARLNQRAFLGRERGQALLEYALILILIAVIVVAILLLLGPTLGNTFSRITAGIQSPSSLYPSGSASPP